MKRKFQIFLSFKIKYLRGIWNFCEGLQSLFLPVHYLQTWAGNRWPITKSDLRSFQACHHHYEQACHHNDERPGRQTGAFSFNRARLGRSVNTPVLLLAGWWVMLEGCVPRTSRSRLT